MYCKNVVKEKNNALQYRFYLKLKCKYQKRSRQKLKIQESLERFRFYKLSGIMNLWKRVRILQEYKRNLWELSDWTYSRNQRLKCTRVWRDCFQNRIKEKQILELVRDFRERKIKQEFIKELKKKMLTRRYVMLSRDMYLKKIWFYNWTLNVRKKEEEREQEECRRGINYCMQKRLRNYLRQWAGLYRKIQEKKEKEICAIKLSLVTIKRNVTRIWREELKNRKTQKRWIMVAERYSKKRILRSFMGLWDQCLVIKQEMVQKMQRAQLFYECKLKLAVFKRFQKLIFEKVEGYYFMESAVVHHNRFLALHVLKGLKEHVLANQVKREEESKIVNTIRKRYLLKWIIVCYIYSRSRKHTMRKKCIVSRNI
jgi:hypothetical protein